MLKMNSVLSVVLALCFASLAYSCESEYKPTYNDEFSIDENEEWEQFKIKFMKKYDSREEEEFRRLFFVKSLRETREHNLKFEGGEVSYSKAINTFSDMHHSEVPKGLVPVSNETLRDVQYYELPADASVPAEVDWRTKGVVTEVKNQLRCGSCWAFSVTGVLEGQIAIKNKKLVSLSEQNLVDCDKLNHGCQNGSPIEAYRYIFKFGIDSEQSYPYEGVQDVCKYNKADVAGTLKKAYRIYPAEKYLKIAVATVGPIAVAIDATGLSPYHGGIYKSSECSSDRHAMDHAVLVVGYGTTEKGEDYWIVKNSWGKSFGEEGYVRMARNHNNMCGIANLATFPTI